MNYIGSKHSIIDFIEESIIDFAGNDNKVFCDIFAGTGVVGKRFKSLGFDVLANDTQFYSYVINKHYLENNSVPSFSGLKLIGISDPFISSVNVLDAYPIPIKSVAITIKDKYIFFIYHLFFFNFNSIDIKYIFCRYYKFCTVFFFYH